MKKSIAMFFTMGIVVLIGTASTVHALSFVWVNERENDDFVEGRITFNEDWSVGDIHEENIFEVTWTVELPTGELVDYGDRFVPQYPYSEIYHFRVFSRDLETEELYLDWMVNTYSNGPTFWEKLNFRVTRHHWSLAVLSDDVPDLTHYGGRGHWERENVPVPEPSALILLSLGLAGGAAIHHKRRHTRR